MGTSGHNLTRTRIRRDDTFHPSGTPLPLLPAHSRAIARRAILTRDAYATEEKGVATAVAQEPTRVASKQLAPVRLARKHPLATIGAVVALFYLVYLLHAFTGGHDARSFIMLERFRLLQSHSSRVIKVEPGFPYAARGWGYDGQYYYMMALDPVNARNYVFNPTYYYSRVLYPLTARALALGKPDFVPYTLILINLVSVIVGTVMIAAWLRRKHVPPWFALIYAGYSGMFISFQRDLTEPMAYALLAAGIYLLEFGGRRRVMWSGLCFALGTLTRDKAAILALAFTLSFLLYNEDRPDMGRLWNMGRNLPAAIALGCMTLLPYVALKFFLYLWMHGLTVPINQQVAPLAALFAPQLNNISLLSDTLTSFIPALICLATVLWAFARGARDLSLLTLLVLAVVTSFTLSPGFLVGVVGLMRAAILAVVAALYALPALDRVTHRNRTWLWLCAAFWLSMTPALFIRETLVPWIQMLALVLVFGGAGLALAARPGLRALRGGKTARA